MVFRDLALRGVGILATFLVPTLLPRSPKWTMSLGLDLLLPIVMRTYLM
jgi:hypothetical protein